MPNYTEETKGEISYTEETKGTATWFNIIGWFGIGWFLNWFGEKDSISYTEETKGTISPTEETKGSINWIEEIK